MDKKFEDYLPQKKRINKDRNRRGGNVSRKSDKKNMKDFVNKSSLDEFKNIKQTPTPTQTNKQSFHIPEKISFENSGLKDLETPITRL